MTFCREVSSLRAKNNYEARVTRQAKADPKGFFQLYKTKARDRVGPFKADDGEPLSSMQTCITLNEYFATIFNQEDTSTLPVAPQVFMARVDEMLCDVSITREAVTKKIDKLKKTKSPGPDDMYPRVLKETKDIISEPLTNIFRKSVDTGIVPTEWKKPMWYRS